MLLYIVVAAALYCQAAVYKVVTVHMLNRFYVHVCCKLMHDFVKRF